ncbi:unnamed protein product [Rotaria socialis]|uniref:Uncharacterized protein n=1 Tax=Rotaria socialis TaxID=392032 RepID=A0A820NCF1_9BILA|nr:unnamed protein product [Rotaria socialis]CAF4386301.1 unnamed protein product [Rotaria socialis]
MSSTPITSENSSSSRGQSANQVTAAKTSRPPSAAKTSRPPSAAKTSRPSSAVKTSRPSSAVKTSRPPSASLKPAENDTTTVTPEVTTNDNDASSDVSVDGKEVTSSSECPPSVKAAASGSRPGSGIHPQSAAKNDLTSNTVTDSTNAEKKSSRLPSANSKVDESNTHGYTINVASPRPPSGSTKVDQPSTVAPVNSRPPSPNLIASESTTNDSATITPGSRPTTGSQTTDITRRSDSTDPTTTIGARPQSATQNTVPTNSRPPSVRVKQDETTVDDSTTEQQNTSTLFNANDADATLPIIERPASVAKVTSTDESTITANVDSTDSPVILTENSPSSDEIQPVAVTPRIGSASKIPQEPTATENNN